MRTALLFALVIGALGCTDHPPSTDRATFEALAKTSLATRDRWGIPHIYATTVDDLFFAQGYTTAQDRLWHMEMNRRVAHGRVAEIVGASGVPHDRLVRLLKFRGPFDERAELRLAQAVARFGATEANRPARLDPYGELRVPQGLDVSIITDEAVDALAGNLYGDFPRPDLLPEYQSWPGAQLSGADGAVGRSPGIDASPAQRYGIRANPEMLRPTPPTG